MPLNPRVQPIIEQLGGPAEAARKLDCFKTAFYRWKHVPKRWVLQISELTGRAPHELRPDLYPQKKETESHG